MKDHPEESKPAQQPQHWVTTDELHPEYWTDPSIQEKRGREFQELPIKYLENLEKSGGLPMARREFLTLMGASLAMTGISCVRRPVHKIIPYVVQPEELTPGLPVHYATHCTGCASKCGVMTKNRDGRPIKLEGLPDHPVNKGSLCARGQASILDLYDPERGRKPFFRDRATGGLMDLNYEALDKKVLQRLEKVTSGKVRILLGAKPDPAMKRLTQQFLSRFKDGKVVVYDPIAPEGVYESMDRSFGVRGTWIYEWSKVRLVLSLGSDFLADGDHLYNTRGFMDGRRLRTSDASMSKLVVYESHFSLTGSNADERFAIRPGDEMRVAAAVIHEWLIKKGMNGGVGTSRMKAFVTPYSPEQVAEELGLKDGAKHIQQLARDLLNERGRSLILAGSLTARSRAGMGLEVMVHWMNDFLGNVGSTLNASPDADVSSTREVLNLFREMQAGQVEVLLMVDTNPAFTLAPHVLNWEEAVSKVSFVVAFASHKDETALTADIYAPSLHALESWGDAEARPGLFAIRQPTIEPLHGARGFEDSLLAWMLDRPKNEDGPLDWHMVLKADWQKHLFPKSGATQFEAFWEETLKRGFLDLRQQALTPVMRFRESALMLVQECLGKLLPVADALRLTLYMTDALRDGRQANNAWLQELPHPLTSVAWDNYVNIGPKLAEKLKIKDGDVLEVKTSKASVELPVYIHPGLHPHTVSLAVGYGRKLAGKIGTGVGVNAFPFVELEGEDWIFAGQSVQLRKTGRLYKLAMTQWHMQSENRPIINDIDLAAFRKNPGSSNHTDPHLRMKEVPTMWPKHEYKNYRWGMSIDLTSCTGCSACMVACQAENNIPVVGRDNVRVSRQMHWIRIDRYFSGDPDQPAVLFQPMLCQHCENAPCETVCPVVATVHDDEGLNVQIYNRCIGTRYCQNNCPYKVRRFNFFDHWKQYQDTMNMVWNPDVTVRSRGVMEKCTFCTQRIRVAKDRAKDQGRKVRDDELKTACQQNCPSNAIVFGNVNDPQAQVSLAKEDPRTFKVLEVLNTVPQVSYQTKVRNRQSGEQAGHEHSHA
jgi:Fe-S-cluster-containing dehydrogenase component/anaerobic selenocysteine-containing dehydrogenase